VGVLEAVFYHLPYGSVEDEVGFVHAIAVSQAIIFMDAKEN
jgi:hypothetical protein